MVKSFSNEVHNLTYPDRYDKISSLFLPSFQTISIHQFHIYVCVFLHRFPPTYINFLVCVCLKNYVYMIDFALKNISSSLFFFSFSLSLSFFIPLPYRVSQINGYSFEMVFVDHRSSPLNRRVSIARLSDFTIPFQRFYLIRYNRITKHACRIIRTMKIA